MKPHIIKLRYVALPIIVKALGLALIFFAFSIFYQNYLSNAIGKARLYHEYLADIKWNGSITLATAVICISSTSLIWLKKPLEFLEFKKSQHWNSVIFSLMTFQSGLLVLAYSVGTYGGQTTYHLDDLNDWNQQGKPAYFRAKNAEVVGIRGIEVRYDYLSKNAKRYNVYCTILLDRNRNLWLGISDDFSVSRGIENPKDIIIEKIIIAHKKCDNTTLMNNTSFKTSNFNLENNGFLAAAKRIDESIHLNLETEQLLVHSKRSMEDIRYMLFTMALILTLLSMLLLLYDTYNAGVNWSRYWDVQRDNTK